MAGISAATMTKLAAVDERFMPSTCAIKRPTTTQVDGRTVYGGEVDVATVACRVQPLGTAPREGMQAGRMDAETDGEIALPLGTSIQDSDHIDATTAGVTTRFEVTGPVIQGSYSTSLIVRVKHEG